MREVDYMWACLWETSVCVCMRVCVWMRGHGFMHILRSPLNGFVRWRAARAEKWTSDKRWTVMWTLHSPANFWPCRDLLLHSTDATLQSMHVSLSLKTPPEAELSYSRSKWALSTLMSSPEVPFYFAQLTAALSKAWLHALGLSSVLWS